MSFENRTRSTDHSEQAARSTQQSQRSTSQEQSTPDPSMMGQIWPSIERAEEHFGMQIPDESTLQRLEDHERAYGRKTHEWIAEGMPTDIMGSPKSMEAFRQRQAERPPEVPTNIERQNRRSVLRSEKAVGNTSTAGETGVPEPVREVVSSRGRSLDGSIQRAMEDRMGDSFGDVRIHTGSTAADACEAINARAFTVGNHIAFNSGEYDPSSPEGQHVLAHELAHVRQQTQGAVSMLPQEDMELEVDPDPALEREAEETAQRVMEGGELDMQRMEETPVHIQRLSSSDSGGQITDTVALKNDIEVATESMKAAGKEFTKRFVPNELFAAYEAGKAEAESQANEGLTLDELGVSEEWTDILKSSPSQWKEQITQEAVKAAKAATGSGNSTGDAQSRR